MKYSWYLKSVKKYLTLLAILSALFLVSCSEGDTIYNTIYEDQLYTATFVLDFDGDGLAHYPFGPDMDDDDDGLLVRFAGGSDVDDQDPDIGVTGLGNGLFSTPHFYWGSEDDPEKVGFADFNNDGWLDPFLLESSIYAMGVYLNQGNQVFNTAVHYGIESTYDDDTPALGDFDEDGFLDIAVVGDGVKILWGNGDGYFSSHEILTVFGTGLNLTGAISVDFDEDGHLDLAVSDTDSGTVMVAFNDGNGNFGSLQTLTVTNADTVCALKFGDLDGDGHFDIVVPRSTTTEPYQGVSVYLGDGNGNFSSEIVTDFDLRISYDTNVALGDFNEDGDLDIIAGGETSDIIIAFGDGDGTFSNATNIDTDLSSFYPYYAYNVSDITGDGHLDAVLTEDGDELIAILKGNGDGTFTIGALDLGYDVEIMGASVADFNGDGIFDIAVSSDESSEPQAGLYVVYGQSDTLVVE